MEKGLSIFNFIFNWGGGGSLPQVRVKKMANFLFNTSIGEVTSLRTAVAHWLQKLFHSLISTRTYFFGVSFIEQVQEPADYLSDPELMQYQPLRDMSQDLEKILEHLHSK